MRGPKLNIAITVLPDGQVVFGDLPPELAEVAIILGGQPLTATPSAQATPTDAATQGATDSPDPHQPV